MNVKISPPIAARPPAAIPPVPVFRLTVEEYHRLIDGGYFDENPKLELLDGYLVEKMPESPEHAYYCGWLDNALRALLAGKVYSVRSGNPITLSTSEPEPDVSIARGELDEFFDHHPGPAELLLTIEISLSSLSRDSGWKKEIYAAAGVAVYWLIDVANQRLEIYTEPTGEGSAAAYQKREVIAAGQSAAVVVDGTEVGRIANDDLFRRARRV